MIFLRLITKKNFLLAIWFTFFASLNLNPIEFFELNVLNKIRILLPFILSLIFVIFNLNKIEISKIIRPPYIFFYIIFILYIYFNQIYPLNNNINIFWPLYMFLSFLILQSFTNLDEKRNLLNFTILILVFVFVFFVTSGLINLYTNNRLHLYGIGIAYSGGIENPPRSSGLARLSLIIFSFLTISYICTNKVKEYKSLFLIFFFASFTLLFQSRTTSFIFIIINIFLIIFYFNRYFFDKRLIFFAIFLPFILNLSYSIYYFNYFKPNLKLNIFALAKDSLIRDHVYKEELDIYSYSSGRFENWKSALIIINKNPLKGYGAQADRILVKQSIHNAFLYAFLAGGIVAGFITMLIYFYSIWLLLKVYFINRIKFQNNIEINICALLIIILNLRSLLETSFAIFSVDFLIYILAILILNDHLIKKKIKKEL